MKSLFTMLLSARTLRRRHKLGHVFARVVQTGTEPVTADRSKKKQASARFRKISLLR